MLKKKGEGFIDVAVIVISSMLVIALAVSTFSVFITKNQLDIFASELCREAQIAGRVGAETTTRTNILKEKTGLDPIIIWSKSGDIQLNQEIRVTVKKTVNIGFGGLGSFPIELIAKSSGKSEVYHK